MSYYHRRFWDSLPSNKVLFDPQPIWLLRPWKDLLTVDNKDIKVAVDVSGEMTVDADVEVAADVEAAVNVGGTGTADDEGAEEAPDVGGKLTVDNQDVEVDVDDEMEDDKAVVKEQFMHVHVVIKCRYKCDILDWKWACRRFS